MKKYHPWPNFAVTCALQSCIFTWSWRLRALGVLEPVQHGLLGGVEEDVLLGRHPRHQGGHHAQVCPHLQHQILKPPLLTPSPSLSWTKTSHPAPCSPSHDDWLGQFTKSHKQGCPFVFCIESLYWALIGWTFCKNIWLLSYDARPLARVQGYPAEDWLFEQKRYNLHRSEKEIV